VSKRTCADSTCITLLRASNPGPLCSCCDAREDEQAHAARVGRAGYADDPDARVAAIMAVLAEREATIMQIALACGSSSKTAGRDLLALLETGMVERGRKYGGGFRYRLLDPAA